MSSAARPRVLAIETSCDDTACAVVDGAGRVLSSVVSSQLAAHRPYGGVVPEIASREHLRNWPPVSAEALARAGLGWPEVDVVAATRGPGLVGALLVGLSLGKAIAYGLGRPFHAIHHLEGHLYSPFLRPPAAGGAAAEAAEPPPADPVPERFTGLVLSGGHTALYGVERGAVDTLGETRDDAMGEVFDKVGKRLSLPYPQGPHVDRLAEAADGGEERTQAGPGRFGVAALPGHDFSFSGLKSQALKAIEGLEARGVATDLAAAGEAGAAAVAPGVSHLLAEFRAAAVAQVLGRLERLAEERPLGLLAVSGGAAANRRLRRDLAAWCAARGVELRLVPLVYSGDNAAMIAHAALLRHRRGLADDPFTAEAASRLPLAG
ncbi:MAG TPA: tRNA (adenosine(37)-N6)-threonylcarbamoyltransferase complex transferase subunit TsaD [Thermoanaerobaculia bacterium]